jgi:hypothetical protein
MSTEKPKRVNMIFVGEAAERLEEVASAEGIDPTRLVERSLGLYSLVAERLRTGDQVVVEEQATDGSVTRYGIVLPAFDPPREQLDSGPRNPLRLV